jgi:hypothetical protein
MQDGYCAEVQQCLMESYYAQWISDDPTGKYPVL